MNFIHTFQNMISTSNSLYSSLSPCGCLNGFKNQEIDFIKDYKYWFLALNWEQGFLGRSLLMLKDHKIDEVELTAREAAEKHKIYCFWHEAITKAFAPDKINQAQLGNEEFLHKGHLHWHFVPRYRRPITFAGAKFQSDNDQSKKVIYSDIHKRIVYPVDIRKKIKEEIIKYL